MSETTQTLTWDVIETDPRYSKDASKLRFFKDDGTEASETDSAKSHPLEFLGMERATPKEEEMIKDNKGRPGIKFHFKDLTEMIDKSSLRSSGTRFSQAMIAAKPQPGDKIQILRTGSKMSVQYFVTKLS